MTIDQLHLAIRRAFLDHCACPWADLIDELVAIAGHHAAEEVAASREADTGRPGAAIPAHG